MKRPELLPPARKKRAAIAKVGYRIVSYAESGEPVADEAEQQRKLEAPPRYRGPPIDPIAVTVEQALCLLSISPARLYQLLAAGKIRGVKHGSRTLLLYESLKAWITSLPPAKGKNMNLTPVVVAAKAKRAAKASKAAEASP
jgi:excisionase family DNA binding protein